MIRAVMFASILAASASATNPEISKSSSLPTHHWRDRGANSRLPQHMTLSRSSSSPNPAFLFRPETATRSQEGPAVRILFPPAKSQVRTGVDLARDRQASGKPLTIMDLSGVPSEIADVVVSLSCRLLFDFAVWSDRGRMPPLLPVCEEAHRYVPAHDRVGFAATARAIMRIAREGRKYGVSLALADGERPRTIGSPGDFTGSMSRYPAPRVYRRGRGVND
jgi:hypothetical protein